MPRGAGKPTARRWVPDFAGNLVRGLGTQQSNDDKERTPLDAIIGVRELSSRISWGAALTEFNFTFLLMFFHVSIVRACTDPGVFSSPVLAIAVAKGVVILLCTYAGAASGAHMNPNVTLATLLIGFTTICRFVMYTAAQLLGAILGIAAARCAHGWDVAASPSELGACGIGEIPQGGALVASATFFHFILSIIGGVAFDERQGAIFGPILGPVAISAAVGVSIFASARTAMMINWAECVAIGIVGGDFDGNEWISFVGPLIASVVHAVLFLGVPPSQANGHFTPPLLRNLREASLQPQEGSVEPAAGEPARKVKPNFT